MVLEQDLILTPDKNGVAHITQDDFGNKYDRTGGPYSNFKPWYPFSTQDMEQENLCVSVTPCC